jgi:hypothetical protein
VHGSSDRERRAGLVLVGQIVLAATWLGAAAFFSAVMAPAAFAVLPTRELAGALVGRVLPVLFIGGAITGLLALALEGAGPRVHRAARIAALSAVVASCAIAQLGVAPRLAAVRAGLAVPLASLSASDPQRIAFGRLHMISVAWLALAMLGGAATIMLAVLSLRRRPAS